jgi:DNA repair protein RadC
MRESAEVQRMTAAAAPTEHASDRRSDHDQTLFEAIEALADRPGLAGRLHDVLKGESSLLFGAQIGARLQRAGLLSAEAERVQRVMAALATVAAWWPHARQRVQSPADLAAIATPLLARREREELHVAIVDGRNGLRALQQVYVGTATGTSVRIAELLRPVIELGGVGFALVHNHPSGDPEPSEEDVRLTGEVVAAARLLDLELLDHLVIGHGRWSSIRSQRPGIWGAVGLPE